MAATTGTQHLPDALRLIYKGGTSLRSFGTGANQKNSVAAVAPCAAPRFDGLGQRISVDVGIIIAKVDQ